MKSTLYRGPGGELHETGPVDWKEGTVSVVCDNVPDGITDDLEATRKGATCEDCAEIGPRWEWSDDWQDGRLVVGEEVCRDG